MIVHSYIQTPGGMGLGDFLRGSLACHQLCTSGRTPYVITFKDHPIGEFIIPRGSVPDVHINNLNNQCNRLTDLRAKLSGFRSRLRGRHPTIGVHCNTFPSFPLNRHTKLFVSHAFTPNDKLQSMIDEVTPTEPYEVIHVRTGDKLAYSTAINFTVDVDRDSMMKYIIDKINEISSHTSNKLIIMCDSDAVKKELTSVCNVHPTAARSVHMNIVEVDDTSGVTDTLVDFFLLKTAKAIHQFSVHNWGSTFSNCAHWLYDVPLKCYKLDTL